MAIWMFKCDGRLEIVMAIWIFNLNTSTRDKYIT